MDISAFILVHGRWRHASSSADMNHDLEGQIVIGTHASFALPMEAQHLRAAAVPDSTRTLDDVVGDARLHVTRGQRRRSLSDGPRPSPSDDISPPPYADAELPAYSVEPNDEVPVTLAKYILKFGFLFPPLWVLGAVIWMCPLNAPADFEPLKPETERAQLVQMMRDAEVRWAKWCVWALGALLVLVCAMTGVVLVS